MAGKQKSKVGSSNVANFNYDRKEKQLTVDFMRKGGKSKNATYVYDDVPPSEARGLARAKSKGRYMNTIAYDYDFTRTR